LTPKLSWGQSCRVKMPPTSLRVKSS
jgi:hypothetical protein